MEEGRVDLGEAAVFEGEPFVVVGVPAFNEEKTIAKVVVEAQKYADKVVVCDDGSTDMTAEIAECLGADVVRHERNLGYGAAISSVVALFTASVLFSLGFHPKPLSLVVSSSMFFTSPFQPLPPFTPPV